MFWPLLEGDYADVQVFLHFDGDGFTKEQAMARVNGLCRVDGKADAWFSAQQKSKGVADSFEGEQGLLLFEFDLEMGAQHVEVGIQGDMEYAGFVFGIAFEAHGAFGIFLGVDLQGMEQGGDECFQVSVVGKAVGVELTVLAVAKVEIE